MQETTTDSQGQIFGNFESLSIQCGQGTSDTLISITKVERQAAMTNLKSAKICERNSVPRRQVYRYLPNCNNDIVFRLVRGDEDGRSFVGTVNL
jgi:hypothetical protein